MTCGWLGCARPYIACGYCDKHYKQARREGLPMVRLRSPRRPNTYAAVHNRLTRIKGPARQRECSSCGKPAATWAYDHSDPEELLEVRQEPRHGVMPYSLDLERYVPLCYSCHRRLDWATRHG